MEKSCTIQDVFERFYPVYEKTHELPAHHRKAAFHIMNCKTGAFGVNISVHDSKLLIPTLKDFFSKHPLINPKTFLGDAAFDTAQLYKSLLTGDTFGDGKHFSKAYIPLNARSGLENQDYTINENGIPCCPNDPSLPMKYIVSRNL